MEVKEAMVDSKQGQVNVDDIILDLREKNKGKRLFYASSPYTGLFVFRQQTMADVKMSVEAVDKYVDEKIASLGGHEVVEKLPLDQRNKIARETDAEAGDISNMVTLKACVIYPETFADDIDNDRVPSGVVPMLLEKIMEISGWADVEITEV